MNNNNIPSLTVKVGGEFTIEKFKADGTVTHTSHHKNIFLDQGLTALVRSGRDWSSFASFVVAMGEGSTAPTRADTALESPLAVTTLRSSQTYHPIEVESDGVFIVKQSAVWSTAIGFLPQGGMIREIGLQSNSAEPAQWRDLLVTRSVLDEGIDITEDEGVRIEYTLVWTTDARPKDLGTLDGYDMRFALRSGGLTEGNTSTSDRSFCQALSYKSPNSTVYLSSNPIPAAYNQTPASATTTGASIEVTPIDDRTIEYTVNASIARTADIRTVRFTSSPGMGNAAVGVVEFTPAIPKTADNSFKFVFRIKFKQDYD